MPFNCADYFERRKERGGGELLVKGTRVPGCTVLASLAEGATAVEIHGDFSTVSMEAVRVVIAFAVVSAEEDLPLPGLPTPA